MTKQYLILESFTVVKALSRKEKIKEVGIQLSFLGCSGKLYLPSKVDSHLRMLAGTLETSWIGYLKTVWRQRLSLSSILFHTLHLLPKILSVASDQGSKCSVCCFKSHLDFHLKFYPKQYITLASQRSSYFFFQLIWQHGDSFLNACINQADYYMICPRG